MKSQFRAALAAMLLIFALTNLTSAQTEDDLSNDISNGRCPVRNIRFNDIPYKEYCGENYLTEMKSVDAMHCQIAVDNKNKVIQKYNSFVRKCFGNKPVSSRRSVSVAPQSPPTARQGNIGRSQASIGSAPPVSQASPKPRDPNVITSSQMSCMASCMPSGQQFDDSMAACDRRGQSDPMCAAFTARLGQCSADCR